MIWDEMKYNALPKDGLDNLEAEPEELFEYYKRNSKEKEEDFDGFDQANTLVLS